MSQGGVQRGVASHAVAEEHDAVGIDAVCPAEPVRPHVLHEVHGVLDAVGKRVGPLGPPGASVVRHHDHAAGAAQRLRHVVHVREAGEAVEHDDAGPSVPVAGGGHHDLPIDGRPGAVEGEGLDRGGIPAFGGGRVREEPRQVERADRGKVGRGEGLACGGRAGHAPRLGGRRTSRLDDGRRKNQHREHCRDCGRRKQHRPDSVPCMPHSETPFHAHRFHTHHSCRLRPCFEWRIWRQ